MVTALRWTIIRSPREVVVSTDKIAEDYSNKEVCDNILTVVEALTIGGDEILLDVGLTTKGGYIDRMRCLFVLGMDVTMSCSGKHPTPRTNVDIPNSLTFD